MPVHRLDNARWGFDSNCFVCEAGNQAGLGIAFFHDDEAGVVFAEFALGPGFSGSPRYVHGGVTLAVLDEAMAWTTIAVAGKFALTLSTEARFLRPVAVDRHHRVEARLVDHPGPDGHLSLAGVVLDGRGRRCVEATSRFAVMSPAVADSAIGALAVHDARYVGG
ncbi:MAG: PaaI family thioesterase [Acidimicrobiales bacterium]